jgi:error-prone DNA polymerase
MTALPVPPESRIPNPESRPPNPVPYTELHCHSAFSLGDGASTPEALAARARELGYGALALTDHDDLGGAARFQRACEVNGIRAIHGAELTLEDGSHLTLLVQDAVGWRNLSSLITLGRTGRDRGDARVPLTEVLARSAGLIALSGCPRGRIPALLAAYDPAGARAHAERLRAAFGDRLYLECWDHRTHAEASLTADLLDLSRATGIPWVVTHDVHYAAAADRPTHDVQVCTRLQLTLAEAEERGLLRPSAEWCLQDPREMATRWARLPEGIARTAEIAARCTFGIDDIRPAPPAFPLPPGEESVDAMLARLARAGLEERMGGAVPERHRRQLEHELWTIEQLDIADHFLIVWDLCRYAREMGVLCQGRGSAANSIVCYALRVTAVDPVAHDLLFERFVSPERPEPPDIDIDFPSGDDREAVLQYVYARYGRAHAAMVCVSVEYRARSAIRDAMRALGFPAPTADWLAKRIDGTAGCRTAADWLELAEGKALRAIGLDPAEPRARALVRAVRGLQGIPRHRGIHPGGFILSREPLGGIAPIEDASMPERTVIQWDKDDCADLGLPKFDLLGLGMLHLLGECMAYVERRTGEPLDLGRIPLDDPAVYAQVTAADTIGLFQIESRAQANFLPRLQPKEFYDIVITVGAIRPGPMLGGQVKEMLARRRGEMPTEYPHPDLAPVLGRTHGLALFQEQLMRCAIVVSGCSPGEADALRRAMSRKRSRDDMNRATETIREGMRRRGVDPASAERVLGWLEACASYTFPESHAISFALLAYASAWLRLHYPAEYLVSILNAQPMGFYPVATLIHDAKEHGVEVRPVDLAVSGWDCSLEGSAPPVILSATPAVILSATPAVILSAAKDPWQGGDACAGRAAPHDAAAAPCHRSFAELRMTGGGAPAVRMGLRYVRGIGARGRERLRRAREAGPFTSLPEAVARMVRAGVGDAELRALAAAGAFRSWVPGGRREALWAVLGELRRLRTGGPLAVPPSTDAAALPRMTDVEETLEDHRSTGFTLAGHPMRHLRERLQALGVEPIGALRATGRRQGERVLTAGMVIVRQRPGTAKGFVFMSLEDETSRLDVIITPKLYAAEREIINGSGLLAVAGVLGVEDGVVNLKATRFFPLQLADASELVRSHDYH